jgi:hypothetical protein
LAHYAASRHCPHRHCQVCMKSSASRKQTPHLPLTALLTSRPAAEAWSRQRSWLLMLKRRVLTASPSCPPSSSR